MALSGLDIYKLLPKTNCKECGFATCLAFAMALAQKKVGLDKCPHVSAAAREALESASQPPIKLVTIGTGDGKLEIGNETVMYRHEQKFHHPAGIGFLVEDTLGDTELKKRVTAIGELRFERVGQVLKPDIICIANPSRDRAKFAAAVKTVAAMAPFALALASDDIDALRDALALVGARRPLIVWNDGAHSDAVLALAKEAKLPVALGAATIDAAAAATDKARKAGVEELVINITGAKLAKAIQDITLIRRTALKKNLRVLGYPVIAFTTAAEPSLELAEAISYVLKYAGIVIVKNTDKDYIFPLLVARQDVYTDPQKPVQVEPKVYEIGKVTAQSPVLVTTNFSITYFTVAGEVESSKVPSYLLCCDSEGMSVLTAWAAEKFTAESIAEAMQKSGLDKIVAHKKAVIPGYVAVLSSKLEEASGWKVDVGPREASGIPVFLKGWK